MNNELMIVQKNFSRELRLLNWLLLDFSYALNQQLFQNALYCLWDQNLWFQVIFEYKYFPWVSVQELGQVEYSFSFLTEKKIFIINLTELRFEINFGFGNKKYWFLNQHWLIFFSSIRFRNSEFLKELVCLGDRDLRFAVLKRV